MGLEMPDGYAPYVGNWRNIRPETYKDFEAFIHVRQKILLAESAFQYEIEVVELLHFNREQQLIKQPKYLFTPPRGSKLPLFPVVEPIQSSIILVEGIFDVINLHDKGLTNAVCCFGVKNVTCRKITSIICTRHRTNRYIFR